MAGNQIEWQLVRTSSSEEVVGVVGGRTVAGGVVGGLVETGPEPDEVEPEHLESVEEGDGGFVGLFDLGGAVAGRVVGGDTGGTVDLADVEGLGDEIAAVGEVVDAVGAHDFEEGASEGVGVVGDAVTFGVEGGGW